MSYRIGILTSLYDDYAVELIQRIDRAIDEGFIKAKISFILSTKGEGESAAVDNRISKLRQLRHIENFLFLSAKNFLPEIKAKDRERWREMYDKKLMSLLPSADSYLNVGYMQIISKEMLDNFTIVNLHPALPWMGPVGMWPKVMEEQAERPLPYLTNYLMQQGGQNLAHDQIEWVMDISWNRAGGMLHIVSEEPDRGPVISWYELKLTSPELDRLWGKAAKIVARNGIDHLKNTELWETILLKIREEQFKGEEPLILITYRKLSLGEWEIQDRRLHIRGQALQGGYCLNREIIEYLEVLGVSSLIK